MKRLIAILMLCAAAPAACLAAYEFAYRLPAEIQTPGPQALEALTWQQGSTPLIQVDVLRRGRPVTADTNTTVRMIIGTSATGTYYAVATNTPGTNTSYYIQWPTIGTNSCGTGTTATAWFYTVYFEAAGKRYWTGNGDLYIEPTTSTDPDGLVWQEFTSGYAVWGTVTGTLSNQTDLWTALAGKASTSAVAALQGRTGIWEQAATDGASATGAVAVLQGATNALNTRMGTVEGWGDHSTNGYATGTPVYVETDPVWASEKAGYATGTPLYVYSESDPVWEAAKSGYATGTPVYAESDPVWEAAKSGYATGTPVYAESDPVWSAARTNYDEATNTLHNRLTALDAASTGAVAVLTGRVLALDAASTGAVPILQGSTQALNGRLTALDAASTGAVAVLQGATNTLDGRVTALEGGGAVSNWSAYPARQIVDVAGNSLSNVYSVTAQEPGFTVLDEPFTNDVFTAGTWTNTVGEWEWAAHDTFIMAVGDSVCVNMTTDIVSGRSYRVVSVAGYGFAEGYSNNLVISVGGESVTLTSGSIQQFTDTNYFTAVNDSRVTLAAEDEDTVSVNSLLITDITPSNSVYIPRLESDRVTIGGETRTNWPGEYDSNTAFQGYTATVDPGAGETVTVAYAHGSLVKIVATNGLTTLTFDNAAYPTAGVSRVAINLWAGTNGIGFDSLTITNETAPTIPTNAWKGLMFRRIEGGLWYGREY